MCRVCVYVSCNTGIVVHIYIHTGCDTRLRYTSILYKVENTVKIKRLGISGVFTFFTFFLSSSLC